MGPDFLAFLGISALVIVTPGPDTAMTIRNSLLGGRAGGIATAAGVALGQSIWALATSLGVVALLVASEPLFVALKLAGAAYLIWLGVQAIVAAVRHAPANRALTGRDRPRLAPRAAFRQGVISNLGNPKMAMFFASLLPQFVPANEPTIAGLLGLGCVFVLMTLTWLALYAAVIARARDCFSRSRVRRAIEGVTGAVLIGLGLRLATEQR
jgi:RhtB (resistance to homoserine/threonine) family protein